MDTTVRITAVPRPGGRVLLRCLGEIDSAAAPELTRELQRWVDGSCCVVLDLCGVTYLDASGLTALLVGLRHAEQVGGRLRLGRGVSRQVRRVLAASGVQTLFDDADAANPCAHGSR
ncbi:STAS domain-containing protein [Pseudonocardia phyllosphaerae]|uniref:STAS domain-containing protein n=1 Tax=Pseudonocardia phyllosphaerae TaxID=3390502 RepID=UPI00397D77DF